MSEMRKNGGVENTTLRPVPPEEKRSWISVMFVQAGAQIAVVSLMLGSLLATSMTLKNALIAGFIGYAIVAVFIALVGIIGAELSVPTCIVASSPFGKQGSKYVVSIVFAFILMGWFSMQNTVCGAAFSGMLEQVGIHFPVTASIIIWGIIMITTSIYGFNAMDKLNYISIPVLLVFMIIACYQSIKQSNVTDIMDMGENTLSMVEGIGITVGFSAFAFATAPDFTRYQKTRKETILANGIGLAGGGFLMLVMGAILSNMAGDYDITVVLTKMGYPVLGMIVLILATWTTNTTNIYCGGINLVMTLNLKDNKRALISAIMGIVGIITSVFGLFDNLSAFIDVLSSIFMPIAGTFIADYYVLCKGKPENWRNTKGWNWRGFVSTIVGGIIVFSFASKTGLNGFLGLVATFVLYLICSRIGKMNYDQSLEDLAKQ